MTKERFVERMLEDAARRKREETEKAKRLNTDFADYLSIRKMQVTRYLWRKRKR